jgi:hypothetical protein
MIAASRAETVHERARVGSDLCQCWLCKPRVKREQLIGELSSLSGCLSQFRRVVRGVPIIIEKSSSYVADARLHGVNNITVGREAVGGSMRAGIFSSRELPMPMRLPLQEPTRGDVRWPSCSQGSQAMLGLVMPDIRTLPCPIPRLRHSSIPINHKFLPTAETNSCTEDWCRSSNIQAWDEGTNGGDGDIRRLQVRAAGIPWTDAVAFEPTESWVTIKNQKLDRLHHCAMILNNVSTTIFIFDSELSSWTKSCGKCVTART